MDPAAPNPYQAPTADTATGQPVLTDAELRAFLGGEDAYYEARLGPPNRSGGWYAGFNWACAVFGFLWMFYRRMAIEGVIAFVLSLAIRLLFIRFGRPHLETVTANQIGVGLFVSMSVAIGFAGNALLLRRARVLVERLRRDPNRPGALEVMRAEGSPSPSTLFLGILGLLGLGALGWYYLGW
jgi:hypothetical protein